MAYTQKFGKHYYVYIKLPGKPVKYRCVSKHPETGQRWTNKTAALSYGREQETLIARGEWVDPEGAELHWDDWWTQWIEAQDVAPATIRFYKALYETHVGPKWGHTSLGATSPTKIAGWLKGLRAGTVETGPANKRRTQAYAPRTTEGIRKMMTLMLDDAVAEGRLRTNVLFVDQRRKRNRGKRVDRVAPTVRTKEIATVDQVFGLALNMYQLAGAVGFVKTITAAFTGLRPGEQNALNRASCLVGKAATKIRREEKASPVGEPIPRLHVADDSGNLREDGKAGEYELAAPKGGLGRTVVINTSLDLLLVDWLEFVGGPVLFPGLLREQWGRSEWGQRWRHAADGRREKIRGQDGRYKPGDFTLQPVLPGFDYKGLRRWQNMALTEIGVPEVIRVHRLGHAMSDEMQAAYSDVTANLTLVMLDGLESLWKQGLEGPYGEAASKVIYEISMKTAKTIKGRLRPDLRKRPSGPAGA